MNRAERRRQQKQKTATYNLTEPQIRAAARCAVRQEIADAKTEAIDEAFSKMLTIPFTVLMEQFWAKTHSRDRKLQKFAEEVVKLYLDVQEGRRDYAELERNLWEVGGFRLEME